jgi:hypothetical protein
MRAGFRWLLRPLRARVRRMRRGDRCARESAAQRAGATHVGVEVRAADDARARQLDRRRQPARHVRHVQRRHMAAAAACGCGGLLLLLAPALHGSRALRRAAAAVRTPPQAGPPGSAHFAPPLRSCVPLAAARGAMAAEDAAGAAEGGAAPPLDYRLERTLTGHSGSVASVKFSPDGLWCAAAAPAQPARRAARAGAARLRRGADAARLLAPVQARQRVCGQDVPRVARGGRRAGGHAGGAQGRRVGLRLGRGQRLPRHRLGRQDARAVGARHGHARAPADGPHRVRLLLQLQRAQQPAGARPARSAPQQQQRLRSRGFRVRVAPPA